MSVEGKLLYEILAHPRTEQLYARYAYTHRNPDGSVPSRIDYVKSILDQACKEFPKKKDSVTVSGDGEEYSDEEYDAGEVDNWLLKWLGKNELVDTVQT